ncbi:hypothetical protein NUSPORA_00279 [Nucleospora cyclopteri]
MNHNPYNFFNNKIKNNFEEREHVLDFKKPKKSLKTVDKAVFKRELTSIKYEDMLIIHGEHKEYMKKLQGNKNSKIMAENLYKADLTGAFIVVQRNKKKGTYECDGIIVQETKNTIIVITKSNKIKRFIKDKIEFILYIEDMKYLFIGKNLKYNRFTNK